MNLKSLQIGRLSIKNNVLIAPLAGFSDVTFRSMCYKLGAGLAFTEMVSAKGIIYGSEPTERLLDTSADEYVKAAQIFGNDPEIILSAVKKSCFDKFDLIDVNFGCPVPKVFNNGEGSALLDNPDLAEKIVKTLVDGGKTVSVKMRLGIREGEPVAVEFGKRMAGAGASMITLHARYRSQYYSGEPDYNAVSALKNAVDVPVIFNGGVFSDEQAAAAMEKTGADGVMLARGVLNRPWLISELLGEPLPDKRQVIRQRTIDFCLAYGEKTGAVNFRKQMAFYLKSVSGGKKLKERIFAAKTLQEYLDVIDEAEFN